MSKIPTIPATIRIMVVLVGVSVVIGREVGWCQFNGSPSLLK
ncbi:MAG: hypothetical protein WD115_05175 [Balneolaceae bacterium]